MKIDELLTHFEAFKREGNGFKVRCPAHDDRTPSLSITEVEDGRIRLKCFAGCSTADVLAALSLDKSDLRPDNGRPAQFKPVVKHPAVRPQPKPEPEPIDPAVIEQMHQALHAHAREYLRRERMLSDQVIERYEIGFEERDGERRLTIPVADEKGICRDARRWLHPKSRTGDNQKMLHWGKGYGKARLYPIDQIQADELVLCEGELDALALIAHDIPAITATCGVSTWPGALSERFKGKAVTILLDHDEAGDKGAQKRAESLCGQGATVKVAKWTKDRPDKWDVTDELREHGIGGVWRILDAAEPWQAWPDPQPLPAKLPPVEKFDPDLLPEAFRPWVEDVAERMQCPPDFAAVAAMVALAAVVGRQVGIRPKQRDDWPVVANLWGAVVGRPGVLKTPAIQDPLKAVDRLEARAREKYEAELKIHEAGQLVADERKKIAKEKIKKVLKDGRDPAQVDLEAVEEGDEPVRQRYICNDTTVEKLGEILNDNPRGILLFRDELTGFLKTLDKDGREGDRSFYLEAWNGTGAHTFDRIGRGTIDIEAACVSILGGIQPGPLSHGDLIKPESWLDWAAGRLGSSIWVGCRRTGSACSS